MISDTKPFLGQVEKIKREHIFKTYNRGKINRCLKLTDLEGDRGRKVRNSFQVSILDYKEGSGSINQNRR